ncbi:hypothetical protein BC835DRAFT_1421208 [Cytidiella melzeri]|nr:hypothetical protein BC835DRAFT_1421208 [Cytidiella melzeri]
MSTTSYGRLEGIEHNELPAAIVFSVIYAPLLAIYLLLSFRSPTFVWRSLAIFCLFRMTGFILRAVIAASDGASANIGLVIAQGVIYSIGFFGLLYSAYTLVLDRDVLTNGFNTSSRGPLGAFVDLIRRTRMLIRLALTVAIICGIISGVKQGNPNNATDQQTALDLRRASLYIFLVVACLLLIVTVVLAYDEMATNIRYGPKHGIFALLVIALLCIVREAFLCATVSTSAQHNKAAYFYPLVATTELICALLFLVPGIVPSRKELLEAGVRNEKGRMNYGDKGDGERQSGDRLMRPEQNGMHARV